ncbi:hypothetical protein BJX66DRAFT_236740 [Aspergillus keveii]|uniref:Uncharacterized protein n=1 Tax=Aspergillus keveii TaxID=714993 RepID=A0ABR4G267_9EURO
MSETKLWRVHCSLQSRSPRVRTGMCLSDSVLTNFVIFPSSRQPTERVTRRLFRKTLHAHSHLARSWCKYCNSEIFWSLASPLPCQPGACSDLAMMTRLLLAIQWARGQLCLADIMSMLRELIVPALYGLQDAFATRTRATCRVADGVPPQAPQTVRVDHLQSKAKHTPHSVSSEVCLIQESTFKWLQLKTSMSTPVPKHRRSLHIGGQNIGTRVKSAGLLSKVNSQRHKQLRIQHLLAVRPATQLTYRFCANWPPALRLFRSSFMV